MSRIGQLKNPGEDQMEMEGSSENDNTAMSASSPTMSVGNKAGNKNPTGNSKKRKKNGGKKGKKSNSCTGESRFQFKYTVKEDHGQPIFGCKFYPNFTEGEPLVVATVGSNRVSIYECLTDGPVVLLQVFSDPDDKEIFYCCAWGNDSGKPLLAAGGANGIIRLFSPAVAACVKNFLGHGNAINDLIFHPKKPELLLSGSKDLSLRLWNIKTDICIAIFAGVAGHRDEVLSIDFNSTGNRVVSSGMDHSLKVWDLQNSEVKEAIEKSYTYNVETEGRFRTIKQNYPQFSTRDIHKNYVDCAMWTGDFIVSKSCENSIVFWKAGNVYQDWDEITLPNTNTVLIHQLEITDCEIWFMKFSMDSRHKVLAVGNQKGKTYIYDLDTEHPSDIKSTILYTPKCNSDIRQTALSGNGRVLICACENGTLWRWDSNESRD